MLTVGSLFAGIGGFDLGFERAGMRTVWFCEQNKFCQRVLARHWPGVPCYPDVRALVADAGRERGERRRARGDMAGAKGTTQGEGLQRQRGRDAAGDSRAGSDGTAGPLPVPVPYVDVICGGFPCQDLSYAGKGAGIGGERSGLWSEYARIVGELRPRYVVVENVPALLGRGLGRVLGDLAALGYDAEWDCLPASAFGAPHRRDRVWIVAYADRRSGPGRTQPARGGGDVADTERGGRPGRPHLERRDDPSRDVPKRSQGAGDAARGGQEAGADPDADSGRREVGPQPDSGSLESRQPAPLGHDADGLRDALADPDELGREEGLQRSSGRSERPGSGDSERSGPHGLQDPDERAVQPWRVGGRAAQAGGAEWWAAEPPVGRVAHGVPDRLDQLAALGNALVPQIAEWIGWRIIEWEEGRVAA